MKYIVLALIFLAVTGVVVMEDRKTAASSEKGAPVVAVAGAKTATFAGGCFWCVEADFEKLDGVVSAVSGYAGGEEKNPTYKQVAMGQTGHREVVQITYDPAKVTYDKLLDWFWRHIDPTDNKGQFVDRGHQYAPAIFYTDDEQKAAAIASKEALQKSKKFDEPIAVDILPLKDFYAAEEYHQDFYKKSPAHYKRYRMGSGRDFFLKKNWD